MVIALEPGVYRNGYGIRLEHVVAVTDTGAKCFQGSITVSINVRNN